MTSALVVYYPVLSLGDQCCIFCVVLSAGIYYYPNVSVAVVMGL